MLVGGGPQKLPEIIVGLEVVLLVDGARDEQDAESHESQSEASFAYEIEGFLVDLPEAEKLDHFKNV